ncbi:hypothetical protein [Marinibactrum halimedae]|uniref:Antitermination protein n=1 Tax=Marinibactrum halimedae TaxID=1444977 RepID=A0AA37WMF7_9GAMM|nr:hypothetical protein [Marinibactrum halimedae]MCD9458063.1 hypothetical protein [Marinibactrum halimedae]GLS24996.1 hypothetical protein GCM10007877_07100 [Marinibactrum halimedae]
MSEFLLTKMNPKGASWEFSGRGGVVAFTQYDIAAALSFGALPLPAYYLARAKYCEDHQAAESLRAHLLDKIEKESLQQDWKITKDNACGIADLLMAESVFDIQCKACKGLGYLYEKSGSINSSRRCEKCNGSGVGVLSQRKRAAMAKIALTTWHRHWNERLDFLMCYIKELEEHVVKHINEQCGHKYN